MAVASIIGVKQGCPQSPTLFDLYIDEVSHYIERLGSLGACLAGIAIQILLYGDNIVLISDSLKELQRHLNALKVLSTDKGLSINMDKIKVMVFNTTQAWLTRSEPDFFLGEENVANALLHIPKSNIHRAQVPLTKGSLCPTFFQICSPWCSKKTMCTFAVPKATN